MFKVLDTYNRYRIKEKAALIAIKELKLNHECNEENESELFSKLYYSVFTPNGNLVF